MNPEKGEALAEVKKAHIEMLPIKINDNYINEISSLVDTVITEKDSEIDSTNNLNRIDHIVYQIYGLTYDEVLLIDPRTPITREEYENF